MDVPLDIITPIGAFPVRAIALIILCMKYPRHCRGLDESRCCYGQTNETRQGNFARAQKHP